MCFCCSSPGVRRPEPAGFWDLCLCQQVPETTSWLGQLSSVSFTYLFKGDRSQALWIPKLRMCLFLLHLQEFQPRGISLSCRMLGGMHVPKKCCTPLQREACPCIPSAGHSQRRKPRYIPQTKATLAIPLTLSLPTERMLG